MLGLLIYDVPLSGSEWTVSRPMIPPLSRGRLHSAPHFAPSASPLLALWCGGNELQRARQSGLQCSADNCSPINDCRRQCRNTIRRRFLPTRHTGPRSMPTPSDLQGAFTGTILGPCDGGQYAGVADYWHGDDLLFHAGRAHLVLHRPRSFTAWASTLPIRLQKLILYADH